MATTSVRNTTAGFRGFNAKDGYVELAPGELREGVEFDGDERKNAESTGYFEFGSAAKAEPKAAPSTNPNADLTRNVPSLKKIAAAEGVELGDAKSADDITAKIVAARAAKAAGGVQPPNPGPADDLDNASDDDLRVIVAGLTGKPVEDYATTERTELLELARKPAE